MEQDRGIEARAARAVGHALFGVDQLVERLTATDVNMARQNAEPFIWGFGNGVRPRLRAGPSGTSI